MAESQNDIVTQEDVNDLSEDLKQMALSMREFTSAMLNLYTEQDADDQSDVATKLRKIRDDTRQDAVVYLQCVLPATKNFIQSIKKYFEYYEYLSYEEWCEMLPHIIKETTTYKDLAHAVLNMHQNIMVDLKKRENEARKLGKEFVSLQSKYEKECEEYKTKKKHKNIWAYALVAIPVVNFIAFPRLKKSARENKALAVASKRHSEDHKNAAQTVAETLVPSLHRFIEGLENVAGFLGIVEMDLQTEKDQYGKELHYKMMNKKAKDMKKRCIAFFQILPAVRTDFEALPSKDADKNYVQEWLGGLAHLRVMNTEEDFSNFLSVGMEGVAQCMPAITPPETGQERTRLEMQTSPDHAGEERKKLEIPKQAEYDGQERKQAEISKQTDHAGQERKPREIPTSSKHSCQEEKQIEISKEPEYDGQERKQPEMPTSSKHGGQERKQAEMTTQPDHDEQEENKQKYQHQWYIVCLK